MYRYKDLSVIPVTEVKNVGTERAKLLAKKGIRNLLDLLQSYPRDYEDRRALKSIAELEDGEMATIKGIITSPLVERRIRPGLSIIKTLAKDESGSVVNLVWYNQSYIKRTLRLGEQCYFYGKVVKNFSMVQLQNPAFEKSSGGQTPEMLGIFPVYSLVEGLSQNIMRKIMSSALEKAGYIGDYLPDYVKEEFGLCDIDYAVRGIHFPEDYDMWAKARERLVFDELLLLQLTLFRVRNVLSDDVEGIQYKPVEKVYEFIKSLPYELTNAQKRAFQDIEKDMESTKVMNRLVQGDVGSGKTIVALLAMLKAVFNGYQAAYMAPTEILAEQHFTNIKKLLGNADVNCEVVLLKGSQSKKEREQVLGKILSGEANIIVGTHALIQEKVDFHKLGLVITDEQHRFGVRQRAILAQKSAQNPDVLVMTATPIPRTLALILYGDLDISIIDELPPGRTPVKTYVVDESMRERINNFIIKTVRQGSQVYIVCPAVEEGEVLDIASAKDLYEKVKNGVFRDLRVGLVYGKMKNEEKEQVMRGFSQGKIDVLVSTTVIEVGVDVPNATLMVVENAERFGLAQLHQLRGRVGRGKGQSYCVLYNQSKSELSRERMKILVSTNDGFVISEKDLMLRGPGEFFGTRQHGIPILKIANLYEDMHIMKNSQKACGLILARDPHLQVPEHEDLAHLSKVSEQLLNL